MAITISFITEGEKLIPTSKPVIASGDIDTVTISVAFDSSWDGYAKSGVFMKKCDKDHNVYEAIMDSNNSCIIPHEALDEAGTTYIGIRGVNGASVYTSSLVAYRIDPGAPEGTTATVPPTASVYQQLLTANAVLSSRVDQIASLPAGGTSGDAELRDIRVKADGITADTAGNAVREQVSSLSESIVDISEAVFDEKQLVNLSKHTSVNTAVTYNEDGSFNVGTTDYGNTFIGDKTHLAVGEYLLYGVPKGMSFVATTMSHNTAIVTNSENTDKKFTIETEGDYYVGFRMSSKPSESFTVYPYVISKDSKVDELAEKVNTVANTYYVIEPTGDDTDRMREILKGLQDFGAVFFKKGIYAIGTKLTMPSGSRIFGVGNESVLKFTSTGQMIECGNDCSIENLMLDGGLTSKPSSAGNHHAVRVLDNKQTLKMSNCTIKGFDGTGVRVDNTGYVDLASVQIVNCSFKYNFYGIHFLQHGEYGVVSNCTFIDNYCGAYVQGGNNIITGCTLERNTIGANANGNNIDNNGHGAFIGCSFNHNTSIGIQMQSITNGYLISGCQIFRNESWDLSMSGIGINVCGCQFGVTSKLRFTNDNTIVSVSDCMFGSMPTLNYTDTAKTASANNYTFDGRIVNVLHPANYVKGVPQAMLTIIDDDGHKRFYSDLLPIIRSKNVPISTAIYQTSIGVADNTMTWEQVEEAYLDGAEILSHSYDHADSTDMESRSQAEIQRKYQMAKNGLLHKGYYGGNYLIYAGATGNIQKVKESAQNVFDIAFNSSGNVINQYGRIDPYNIKRYRVEVDYGYTPSALNALIDECKANGGWMVWMIHTSADVWGTDAINAISSAIDHAREIGLPIVTADAGAKAYGLI